MVIKNKGTYCILALLVFSILYTFLFYPRSHNLISTGDVSFHLSRIKGLESIFSSPVNFETFNNFGYGVNWFYPYVTILPATAIYHLTNDILLSYWLFLLILNVATALICFYCGRAFFLNNRSAFLFSIFYTFSLYRTTDVFFRSALAESIALTFAPIVFLGLFKIFKLDNKGTYFLAFGMILTILTHILSTIILTLVLVVVTAFFFFRKSNEEKKWILLKILKAIIITIIAVLSFVGPMIYMFLTNNINKPATTDLQAKSLPAGTSLFFAFNNDPTLYGIGLIGLLSLIIPIFLLMKFNEEEKKIYLFSLMTWFLSTSLFPWRILQDTSLNIIQFPWRFLGINSFFYAVLLTICCIKYFKITKIGIFTLSLGVCILNVTTSINYDAELEKISGTIHVNENSIEHFTSEGMNYFLYDYVPENVNNFRDKAENHLFYINKKWTNNDFQVHKNTYQTTIKSNISQKVVIPVIQYSNTVIKVNNRKKELKSSQSGLIELSLNKGTSEVTVEYKQNFFFYASFVLTMCILSFLIFICLTKEKFD